MEQRYKLTKAAKMLGVNPWTLRRWVYAGKAPSLKSESGHVFIPGYWLAEQLGEAPASSGVKCALYARESSSENKAAMDSQVDGLTRYAIAKGYQIISTTKEFASGMNDDRKKLHKLLKDQNFDVLLIENKDRLTRFGFRWFESLCPFKIEVVNLSDNCTHDLMEDLVAVITSFAARLYGQRRGRKKTEAAIKAIEETE
ncbi:MAG: IS607 family transposase [Stenomitos rutilans HA7619-LM2]|jgi:predicted site-specific integrase-resolvase|nr:IS607 family transposase [Stenomitos rutilans HA7619-LM2]MBW4469432.1 IS607 family transposase [Stenomitos rutilans HA7619-LM2]